MLGGVTLRGSTSLRAVPWAPYLLLPPQAALTASLHPRTCFETGARYSVEKAISLWPVK